MTQTRGQKNTCDIRVLIIAVFVHLARASVALTDAHAIQFSCQAISHACNRNVPEALAGRLGRARIAVVARRA
jgi:hypothetical protein